MKNLPETGKVKMPFVITYVNFAFFLPSAFVCSFPLKAKNILYSEADTTKASLKCL